MTNTENGHQSYDRDTYARLQDAREEASARYKNATAEGLRKATGATSVTYVEERRNEDGTLTETARTVVDNRAAATVEPVAVERITR